MIFSTSPSLEHDTVTRPAATAMERQTGRFPSVFVHEGGQAEPHGLRRKYMHERRAVVPESRPTGISTFVEPLKRILDSEGLHSGAANVGGRPHQYHPRGAWLPEDAMQ
jgi:hypothetical protein